MPLVNISLYIKPSEVDLGNVRPKSGRAKWLSSNLRNFSQEFLAVEPILNKFTLVAEASQNTSGLARCDFDFVLVVVDNLTHDSLTLFTQNSEGCRVGKVIRVVGWEGNFVEPKCVQKVRVLKIEMSVGVPYIWLLHLGHAVVPCVWEGHAVEVEIGRAHV